MKRIRRPARAPAACGQRAGRAVTGKAGRSRAAVSAAPTIPATVFGSRLICAGVKCRTMIPEEPLGTCSTGPGDDGTGHGARGTGHGHTGAVAAVIFWARRVAGLRRGGPG
jgi:hypothetical protein